MTIPTIGLREVISEGTSSGTLFDGTSVQGVAGLQAWILSHPELFVSTLTEKLLTFATGRGVEYYDGPAIRKIVRDAGVKAD